MISKEGYVLFYYATQHILFAVVWRWAFVYVLLLLGCLLNKDTIYNTIYKVLELWAIIEQKKILIEKLI